MKVKCVICDKICELDDQSLLAKRLRNRPIHTFMCHECHERISKRTRDRWASGKFVLHLPAEGRKGLRS
ncbi:DUF2197 domain-containing protein [Sporolactobacillus vineae]|uniref:YlaI family protein n=1 Tax=Sporolactobacillus vineae TaxID=444463 RepID=UPI0002892A1E